MSPTKWKGKSSLVQADKRSVENTPPMAKKMKTRSSLRRKAITQGTNQFISPIVIDETPQVSLVVHNLPVLADAVVQTVEDEENAKENIMLSRFISRLRSRKKTSTLHTVEVQVEEDV